MITSKTVIFVGFHDQGNLGIGYLAAILHQHGYRVQILDFRQKPGKILKDIKSARPLLIGFSLIFQCYLPQFARLAAYLRSNGVSCHFCMGGHFASLCYEKVLEAVPELDCIVRFEGEVTLLELVQRLQQGLDWRRLAGIAYRQNGEHTTTAIRPLIADLDQLPHPLLPFKPETVLGMKAMPILASRGCIRNCSFCSIHQFYSIPQGRFVRVRSPSNVVREMKVLCDQRGISIFLFQDDDFPMLGRNGRRWALDFVNELHRRGLHGKVIWKISCRADEIEPELIGHLRDAGLYLVYLGLESGTDTGLRTLNKKLRVADNLRAVSILKEVGLMCEFGFMLFDPSSTFETVRANVAFLRRILEDGTAAATFCRMLPYGGTHIKDELARTGRLRGSISKPDYDFLDRRLNVYFEYLIRLISDWFQGSEAVSPQLNWAWHEVGVIQRLFPPLAGMEAYQSFLQSITKASNELLLTTIEETSYRFQNSSKAPHPTVEFGAACRKFLADMLRERNQFIERNQKVMLKALNDNPKNELGSLKAECIQNGLHSD
jgi:radical SAM superfamily enzyme YgiQ (UPF0313 family)